MKVAVVYWSGTGNTEAMAEYVAQGARDAGASVDVFTSAEFSPDKASAYDAFAFGCPSMGAEQLEEGEFEPMFESVIGSLSGKSVGLFGSYGWGSGEWMETWTDQCRNAGIHTVNDGVICNGAPDESAADECKEMGARLAQG